VELRFELLDIGWLSQFLHFTESNFTKKHNSRALSNSFSSIALGFLESVSEVDSLSKHVSSSRCFFRSNA
jgi:hypothetical protein